MSIPTILPATLAAERSASTRLVDVRTPGEFSGCHAVGAVNIPLDTVKPEALPAGSGPVYLICQSGMRATKAAESLAAAGVEVVVVAGGTKAWADAGLPVNRGAGVLPLDRQVRIAVGALALTGAVLAATVNPAWIWLSGFVGCGLVFAGLTDICPLAIAIAAMPWNRASAPAGGSCCAPAVQTPTPAKAGGCCGGHCH